MITDLTPYREDMAEFDMTDEQKLELVNAIWVIGKTILDRKFGLYQPDAPKERLTTVDSAVAKATRLKKASHGKSHNQSGQNRRVSDPNQVKK
jgi:hypothetical protein